MLGRRAAFHQVQCHVVVGADLVVQGCIGCQGLLASREDFLELGSPGAFGLLGDCLLYTSDAADE